MALDLGRWFKYAQAKLDSAARSGNREMDRLEAEQDAELAGKPWLADDDVVPSYEDAKARIERESAAADAPEPPAPTAPEDPEIAAAKVELERREREGAARLDAIREELGIEPPGPGSP